jgi:hypothetical protein
MAVNFLRNLFTERDNVSWCIGRVIGAGAGFESMIRFWQTQTPDFIGFATAIGAIIAAIAAKNYSEK